MKQMTRRSPARWLKPDGTPVACAEKIKVLDQNLAEIADMVREALEDAMLMGCEAGQIRAVLHQLIDSVTTDITE